MKIAFVHEWLVTYAGAERVLEEMINCFPDADIFSLIEFLGPDNKHFIKEKNVTWNIKVNKTYHIEYSD